MFESQNNGIAKDLFTFDETGPGHGPSLPSHRGTQKCLLSPSCFFFSHCALEHFKFYPITDQFGSESLKVRLVLWELISCWSSLSTQILISGDFQTLLLVVSQCHLLTMLLGVRDQQLFWLLPVDSLNHLISVSLNRNIAREESGVCLWKSLVYRTELYVICASTSPEGQI